MYSNQLLAGLPVPVTASPMLLQLADYSVPAGFPSPAEDFGGKRLDLTGILIEHPLATYLLRVAGPSMREYGIDDGDLIVVDRAIRPRHGHIVVATVDGEFTVKFLFTAGGMVRLKAGNPTYPDIVPKEGQTLEIWGVEISCIKRFARGCSMFALIDGNNFYLSCERAMRTKVPGLPGGGATERSFHCCDLLASS